MTFLRPQTATHDSSNRLQKVTGICGDRSYSVQLPQSEALAEENVDALKAAESVVFFTVDGGFQRYEAVRLGGFEQ